MGDVHGIYGNRTTTDFGGATSPEATTAFEATTTFAPPQMPPPPIDQPPLNVPPSSLPFKKRPFDDTTVLTSLGFSPAIPMATSPFGIVLFQPQPQRGPALEQGQNPSPPLSFGNAPFLNTQPQQSLPVVQTPQLPVGPIATAPVATPSQAYQDALFYIQSHPDYVKLATRTRRVFEEPGPWMHLMHYPNRYFTADKIAAEIAHQSTTGPHGLTQSMTRTYNRGMLNQWFHLIPSGVSTGGVPSAWRVAYRTPGTQPAPATMDNASYVLPTLANSSKKQKIGY
jgi:hypothetical protein